MRLLIIFIFLSTTAFSQNANESNTETERLIQTIIELNVHLKTGDYVASDRLVDVDKSGFESSINKYGLVNNSPLTDLTLKHCQLQLINDNEIGCFKALADSFNQNITDPIERKNKYQLIENHFHKKYCEFSIPLYSKNGKHALIEYNVFSGFMYGSFSGTYLMKMINGKWVVDGIIRMTED